MIKNQNGFGVIEILLVIIVAGVLGATGWYAFHTKHQTDKILAQSEKASQLAAKNTVSAPNYIVIKEWGVKLGIGNDKNVTYVITKSNANEAFLVSKSDVNNPNCFYKDTDWPAYFVLLRGKTNDLLDTDENGNIVTFAQAANKYPSEYTKLGGYYYRFMGANGNYSCHTEAEESLANNVLGKNWTPNVQPL